MLIRTAGSTDKKHIHTFRNSRDAFKIKNVHQTLQKKDLRHYSNNLMKTKTDSWTKEKWLHSSRKPSRNNDHKSKEIKQDISNPTKSS